MGLERIQQNVNGLTDRHTDRMYRGTDQPPYRTEIEPAHTNTDTHMTLTHRSINHNTPKNRVSYEFVYIPESGGKEIQQD